MCSIFGLLKRNSPEEIQHSLNGIAEILHHRGPDDRGFFVDKASSDFCLGLGMNRLSIVDRKGGHQPIFNEDRSLVIICNGEIYNFKELRLELLAKGHTFRTETDVEVILHLFEDSGSKCVQRLNGMFAFAIFDRTRKELFLARDRFGIKPLMFSDWQGFMFASETRAFLTIPGFPTELDPQSISDYFSLWYIPAPQSVFKNVRKLMPGHWLRVSANGTWYSEAYWQPVYRPRQRSQSALCEEFYSSFKKAVHSQLIGEVPIGIFMSGGLDSSSIVSVLAEHAPCPFRTFSMGFDSPEFDESPLIQQLVDRFGCNHTHIYIHGQEIPGLIEEVTYALDEPLGVTAYPYFALCRKAKEFVTVVLGGDGGDEIFGGYDTYYGHYLLQLYRAIPEIIRSGFLNRLPDYIPVSYGKRGLDMKVRKFLEAGNHPPARGHVSWREIFNPQEKESFLNVSEETDHDVFHAFRQFIEDQRIRHPINRFMNADLAVFLPEVSFFLGDRLGMHHSLEFRVPFTDNDLFEFAASLPVSWKVRGFTTKRLVRTAMKDRLPPAVINAPKYGFAPPFGQWIFGPLREYFFDLLTDRNLGATGFVNVPKAKKVLEDHLQGKMDNTRKLMVLFGFTNWYNVFMKNQKIRPV